MNNSFSLVNLINESGAQLRLVNNDLKRLIQYNNKITHNRVQLRTFSQFKWNIQRT